MYCQKCGKELNEGARFCDVCGTQVGQSGQSGKIAQIAQSAKSFDYKSILENAKQKINILGKIKIQYFVIILLLLMSIFMSYRGMLSVGAAGYSQQLTFFGNEKGNPTATINEVKTITVIFYLVAIVCPLIPLFVGKKWKSICLLPTKITTIGSLLLFALVLLTTLDEANSSFLGDLVSVKLTIGGFLYLASTIGALVLSFIVGKAIKALPQASDVQEAKSDADGQTTEK